MELAEPRVRAGVWEHTTFHSDPLRRLRRTGLAAMVTVYGARSIAETMIARVRRMHDTVTGTTLSGEPYRANDPELISHLRSTLSSLERNSYFADGAPAAALYGTTSAPKIEADLELLFEGTAKRLESSDVVLEFLAIIRSGPILPLFLRPMQDLLVWAAIDLTPRWLRELLSLNGYRLHARERKVVRHIGALADRLLLESNPAVQACRRLKNHPATTLL